MNSAPQTATLLICTLGGSPEPIVAALMKWHPERVRFVHTPQTKEDVSTKVVPMARKEGLTLDAGRYDLFELPDGQNLANCLDRLRMLTPEVLGWSSRGESFRVVVDITGGTKSMSAALAIQASRWPCIFSYVGGELRTKEGVGVVVSGTEKVVHQANPWDTLGYQAVEEFIVLFDQHAYRAAAQVASETMKRVDRPDRKREFAVLERLAKALAAWDRFEHIDSKNLLAEVNKSANDLRAVLGPATGDRVLAGADSLASHLGELCQATPPSRHHVLDLLANAKRRKNEGRTDDAVARLYRAIEAISQVRLKEHYGIDSTEKVPIANVPEPLFGEWSARATAGVVKLGLQDAYALLVRLGDVVGSRFEAAGLNDRTSPLVARNRSILAHGFERVSDKTFETLWDNALSLAEVQHHTLPSFPMLAEER
jgi:CRISPR-associated protein (TIGR02710 family)